MKQGHLLPVIRGACQNSELLSSPSSLPLYLWRSLSPPPFSALKSTRYPKPLGHPAQDGCGDRYDFDDLFSELLPALRFRIARFEDMSAV